MTAVGTRELRRRLVTRFQRAPLAGNLGPEARGMPEHLVAFEVPIDGRPRWDGPHAPRSRQRIDAVAVGIWRGTGHLVHGFELKASRADLLCELRDPSKSEHAVRSVDRWWLVIGSPTLLAPGDPLPPSWGILTASGHGLRLLREPRPQPGVRDGRWWAGFVTASMRSHGACRGLGYTDGFMAGYAYRR